MKKYSKKIALILVLVLALTAAIPALAAGSTVIEGTYEVSEVSVIVPDVGTATLNPYGLPVKIKADDKTTTVGTLEKPGQIATRPLVGVNMGETDLKVGASVIGKADGNFKFATSAPSATSTANSGLVYLQVKKAGDLSYSVGGDAQPSTTVCGGFNAAKVIAELNAWNQPDPTKKYDPKAADVLTVGTKAASKTFNTTIAKGRASDDTTIGAPIDTPSADGYFVARLVGNIAKKPKKGWSQLDGFEVTIAWEFEPA